MKKVLRSAIQSGIDLSYYGGEPLPFPETLMDKLWERNAKYVDRIVSDFAAEIRAGGITTLEDLAAWFDKNRYRERLMGRYLGKQGITAGFAWAAKRTDDAKFVWVRTILESCDSCVERGNQVYEYETLIAIGFPGSDWLDCGSNCHCILMPTDMPETYPDTSPVRALEVRHYPGGHDHDQSLHGHRGDQEDMGLDEEEMAALSPPYDFAKFLDEGLPRDDYYGRTELERALFPADGLTNDEWKARACRELAAELDKKFTPEQLMSVSELAAFIDGWENSPSYMIARDEQLEDVLDAMGDPLVPDNRSKWLAYLLVDSWANSAVDTDPLAISLQYATAEEFGLDSSRRQLGNWLNGPEAGWMSGEWDRRNEREKEVLRAFVRSEYNATQKRLATLKLDTLQLYRGTGQAGTAGLGGVNLNPASSWTTSTSTALGFAREESGDYGINGFAGSGWVLVASVPRARVLTWPRTGAGCKHEDEVILLGSNSDLDEVLWMQP
jgi:hypothetical protein